MKVNFIAPLFFLLEIALPGFQKPSKSISHLPRGIYAIVDGKPWVARIYTARIWIDTLFCLNITLPADYDTNPNRTLLIRTTDTTEQHRWMDIRIPYFKDTGIYKIGTYHDSGAFASYYGYERTDDISSGKISIYHLSDSNIEGAFNFITESGVIIKDGTFNIPYDR